MASAYLEMPPCLVVLISKFLRNADKFPSCHVFQAIVIHDRPAPRRLTVEDVTASSLDLIFTIEAVTEVYIGPGERRVHLLRGFGPAPRKYGDQMKSKIRRGVLLQDFERVAAVAAAASLEACGAQFGILLGEMGHT